MTDRILFCARCGKHMATLRDAKVRNGMVVYCRECDPRLHRPETGSMPEFMKEFFEGKR